MTDIGNYGNNDDHNRTSEADERSGRMRSHERLQDNNSSYPQSLWQASQTHRMPQILHPHSPKTRLYIFCQLNDETRALGKAMVEDRGLNIWSI